MQTRVRTGILYAIGLEVEYFARAAGRTAFSHTAGMPDFRLRRRWYPFRDSFVEGRNVRPHIPLGHRKASGSGKAHRHDAPAEQADVPARGVEGGEKSADGALYRIFDDNDEPLVIDLEAIDRCQKLRAFTPFDVAQRDFEDEDAGRQEAV